MKEYDLKKFNSVLNRYKFPFRTDKDVIQLGGVDDIKFLSRYYIYYPIGIGIVVTGLGVLIDFFFLFLCAAPFFIYAVYGVIFVQIKKKNNLNMIIFKSNKVHISIASLEVNIDSSQIQGYIFEIEKREENHFEGILKLVSNEEREYDIMVLNSPEESILKNDLKFLAEFFQKKHNASQ